MTRKPNWPELLPPFLAEKKDMPFDWQYNNCCFFASDWLRILTGIDPATDLRAEITDLASAKKALLARGGVEQICEDRCAANDWPEVAPNFAQRGDIATVDTPHGPAIGVVFGRNVAFAGKLGVEFIPISQTRRAWRIC